jgi:hypothetical protein
MEQIAFAEPETIYKLLFQMREPVPSSPKKESGISRRLIVNRWWFASKEMPAGMEVVTGTSRIAATRPSAEQTRQIPMALRIQ